MARFQGNVHAGSDRAAATLLFVILMLVMLFAAWYVIDPASLNTLVNNVTRPVSR